MTTTITQTCARGAGVAMIVTLLAGLLLVPASQLAPEGSTLLIEDAHAAEQSPLSGGELGGPPQEEGVPECVLDAQACQDGRCLVVLTMTERTTSMPSCWVDAPETQVTGMLTLSVSTGEAWAEIEGYTFAGTLKNGWVELFNETAFDWADGCTWVTEQWLWGHVCEEDLQFTYDEAPQAGEMGCFEACEAQGTFRIE